MSDAEGFGPEGSASEGAPPFAVAGPSQLTLDEKARTGTASFTVSNVTGRPVRARVFVLPAEGTDASWFAVAGDAERAIPVAGTSTVDVAVAVDEKAPAGTASFALAAALEEAPDEVVSSPTVAFDVPPPQRRRFPWWIVIVVVAALVLLAGGGIAIWAFTRGGEPEPMPTPSSMPTFASGEFIAAPETYFDLDTNQAFAASGQGEDVYFYEGAGSGELGVVGQGPPRLAVVTEPTFDACEAATAYDDLDAQNVVLRPELQTLVCVRFTDQGRLSLMEIGPVTDAGFPVSFVTWDRS